jgi:hypothetical protein
LTIVDKYCQKLKDIHYDKRKRKTAKEIQACFARVRACYLIQIRLYVVKDNLSAYALDRWNGTSLEGFSLIRTQVRISGDLID